MNVPRSLLEVVETLQDGGLSNQVLTLSSQQELSRAGDHEDRAWVSPESGLQTHLTVVLQLSDTKVYLVSVDGVHREEGSVGEQKIVMSLGVDDNVKSWGHVRVDDQTEHRGVGKDVWSSLSAGVYHKVLGEYNPVEVFHGEIRLDTEHYILSYIDVLVRAVDVEKLILGGVGGVCDGLGDYLLVVLGVGEVSDQLQLLQVWWSVRPYPVNSRLPELSVGLLFREQLQAELRVALRVLIKEECRVDVLLPILNGVPRCPTTVGLAVVYQSVNILTFTDLVINLPGDPAQLSIRL